jgi:polyisoprenyl-phosphate glycosyltransferase
MMVSPHPFADRPFVGEVAALAYRSQIAKKLSVVAPCYNEAETLSELVRRIVNVCERCVGDNYELILVNDCSTDNTWAEMLRLSRVSRQIVLVDLAHNHGHQLALTAGLYVARGDRIMIIDADLQDPPELLAEMMAELDGGADVAYGQRVHRGGESWFKKVSAALFYRILQRLADAPIPTDTGDFRLMTRQVVDVLLSMPEQHRFIRGMVAWIGFRQVPIPYERHPRFAGRTKYPLRRMIRFAVDAITGFSVAPLRLSLYFSLWSVLIAVLVALYALWQWFAGVAVPGWTSIAVIVLAFGGMQMLCLGIMGEYLGRLYAQSKQRPLFVIRSVHTNGTAVETAGEGREFSCSK